jgi:hypothetical protein
MSPRAEQLHRTADNQIAELAERLSAAGEQDLTRPCPGRAKLGDGSVGVVAAHTIDNYQRIAGFVAGAEPAGHGHGHGREPDRLELSVLLSRLASAREALAAIGQLGDEQLDSVSPASEMKFADGERTLEAVIASLLKHQRHQLDALAQALSS